MRGDVVGVVLSLEVSDDVETVLPRYIEVLFYLSPRVHARHLAPSAMR